MKKLNVSPINSYYRFTGKFNDRGRCFESFDLKYCEPHSTFWSLSEREGEENISAYTRRLYITKSEQGVDYKRRNAFLVRLINTALNT